MLENCWIIIALPLTGAALIGIIKGRLPRVVISLIACGSVGLSFLFSIRALHLLLQLDPQERLVQVHLFNWIRSGDFAADFGLLIDPLAVVMLLVVTGVGFLIHLYSIEYMREEEGYARYFAYLNLFIAMMTLLVSADNYLLSFVGWEGVGLCSYLLIGHQLEKRSAGDAAKKAFLVNRIGDAAFLLGILLLFRTFGSLDYLSVFSALEGQGPPPAQWGTVAMIALLLFVGATGKSAQIPLHVWLPDAMEGPTPVSALIHAATMVTAGVYMIVRSAALYSRAPEVLFVIAVTGLLTALMAALIALVQTDIKKVLAYSTISQLGYMFLALGVGAFGAGIFHLVTHAFFKALLFLGAGSVILALHHEQNLFRMGGLRGRLPVTWGTMWIATLALAGFPFLSGFFSKDEILWEAFSSPLGNPLFWIVAVAVAALTSGYMFRLMILVFHGRAGVTSVSHSSVREPSTIVKLPLLILALFSLVAGGVGLPHYLGENRLENFLAPSLRFQAIGETISFSHATLVELVLIALATVASAAGAYLAYRACQPESDWSEVWANRFPSLRRILVRKFLVDEIYGRWLVTPLRRVSENILWKAVDQQGIDGLVDGAGSFMQHGSRRIRRLQSGYVRSYSAWILAGVFLITLYYLAWR